MANKKRTWKLISAITFSGAIALGAASCGGGGGSSDDKPIVTPPPEIPIMPADDHGDSRADATVLPLSGSVAGEIERDGDEDYFRVDVSESGTLTVYTSGTLDTVGELQATDGSVLATDDDGGVGRNFTIEQDISLGAHYVRVRSYSSATGTYDVHSNFVAEVPSLHPDHSDTPAGATPIVLGQTYSGRIDSPTDVDYFRLQIDEPGRLTIRTTGEADPNIAVFDAAGEEVPGIPGSWIVDIILAVLKKGRDFLIRLSRGQEQENYRLTTHHTPKREQNTFPNLPRIELTLTLREEEPPALGLPSDYTLECTSSLSGAPCQVRKDGLDEYAVFQLDLKQYFVGHEGVKFRVGCTTAHCDEAQADGTIRILPYAANDNAGTSDSNMGIWISPNVLYDTLTFRVVALPRRYEELLIVDIRKTYELGPEWIKASNEDCYAHIDSLTRLGLFAGVHPMTFTYSGECGGQGALRLDGIGTATLSEPGIGLSSYEGEWSAGRASGEGTWDRPDGSRYKGDFLDGQRHGEGEWTWTPLDGKEGCRLTGSWRKDEFIEGGGVLIQPSGFTHSGSLFAGAWRNGVFWHGQECLPGGHVFQHRFCTTSLGGSCPVNFPNSFPTSCGRLSESVNVCQ